MLAHYLYGHMPSEIGDTKGDIVYSRSLYHGKVRMERIRITCGKEGEIQFDADVVRPAQAGRVPAVIWNQPTGRRGAPTEEELVCKYGYAVVEFDREQLAPDDGSVKDCILAKAFPECDWGGIAMWAWGHSRLADYLLKTDWADPDKLIVTGHSRGGKAALCAAIYDERFAVCAASGSGCGGGGCFRFLGGRLGEGSGVCETAGTINDMAGYWWTDAFGAFGGRQKAYTRSTFPTGISAMEMMKDYSFDKAGKTENESFLPFDLHYVKALIAPRALITTDGLDDTWSNPYGVQVTWRAAQEVYDFLGVPQNNAMFFHEGGHEYNGADWKAMVSFCNSIFYKTEPECNVIQRIPLREDASLMERMMEKLDWKQSRPHFAWGRPDIEKERKDFER